MAVKSAPYLDPYIRSTREHGAGFRSLLWSSPETQRARFDALVRVCDLKDRRVLDAGCGRADLLDYLLSRGMGPSLYVGLEAIPELVQAARSRVPHTSLIVQGDFVREPGRFLAGADVIVFCGSLNTLADSEFYSTLEVAFRATGQAVALNFLCSPRLAAADWLFWRPVAAVTAFASQLGAQLRLDIGYLDGDCTLAMYKPCWPGPDTCKASPAVGGFPAS